MSSAEHISQRPPFINTRHIPFPHDRDQFEKNNARKREHLKKAWETAANDFTVFASSSIGEKMWEQLDWKDEYIHATLTDVGQLVMSYNKDKIRKIRSALGVGEYLPESDSWKFTRQETLQLMTGIIANKLVNLNYYRKNVLQSGNTK